MIEEAKKFHALLPEETIKKLNQIAQATKVEGLAESLVDSNILIRKSAKKKLERLKQQGS